MSLHRVNLFLGRGPKIASLDKDAQGPVQFQKNRFYNSEAKRHLRVAKEEWRGLREKRGTKGRRSREREHMSTQGILKSRSLHSRT